MDFPFVKAMRKTYRRARPIETRDQERGKNSEQIDQRQDHQRGEEGFRQLIPGLIRIAAQRNDVEQHEAADGGPHQGKCEKAFHDVSIIAAVPRVRSPPKMLLHRFREVYRSTASAACFAVISVTLVAARGLSGI